MTSRASPATGFVGRFRALAEAASDGIIVIDEHSTMLFVNAAVEAIFGHPPETLLGRELTVLLPERFREEHRRGLARYMATGRRNIPWRGVELVGLHATGHELVVEISFGEHEEEGTRVFAGVVRDVTERRFEERRRSAEHAVARILAAAPRPEDTLPEVLDAICATIGLEVGQLWRPVDDEEAVELVASCGDDCRDLVRASTGIRFGAGEGLPGRIWTSGQPHWIVDVTTDTNFPRSPHAAAAGLVSGFGFPVVGPDGVEAVLEFFTRSRRVPDDPMLETMSSIGSQIGQYLARHRAQEQSRSLLDRERKSREAAENAAQMRDQVLAVVGHDLRNYLQVLTTALAVVELGCERGDAELVRTRTPAMKSALASMGQLIDDLLDVQRLEEGNLGLEPVTADAGELLERAVAPYRPQLEEDRGLELRIEEGVGAVQCDPQRTHQVLVNLVENAVKHGGGPVALGARRGASGDIELFVSDCGPGIAPADLPHLFDRFWQAKRSRPGAAGSGLGLAIVKGFVEAQGGQVWVESVEGEGTTFRFTLPGAEARDEE